ncbi:hypothetical protein ATER59S_04039 [Aquamicrobium terrae]
MTTELDHLKRLAGQGRLSRRDFLGRAAALGVSAAFAGTLADKAFAQTPVKGGHLKAGLQGGESSNVLDPALNLSQVNFSFGKCWGELLVELNPDGSLENRIAEEIGASDDAKTWTMKIRKGIEFHDGKTVTPEDVVATLERHSDEKSKSAALGILQGIEQMKAGNDEVVITLKEPNADFPYLMADYHLVIQPNGGKDNPNAGISAGPYKVTVNEPGVRYGGEKFANYWQGDKLGHAAQVEIVVINDPTARSSALQGGQVHMINRVEPKIVDLIKRVPGVTIQTVSGRGFYPFNMFCDTAPFDNNDLRMALKLAMDREELLEKTCAAMARSATTSPSTGPIRCSPTTSSSASSTPRRRRNTTRSRAIPAPSCCAHPTSPSPARWMPRSSTSSPAPRPASRSTSSASPATATGRKCGTSSPSRSPTGADGRRRTRCTPPPTSPAPTGTTRAGSGRNSTRWSSPRAPSSTTTSARSSIATWA